MLPATSVGFPVGVAQEQPEASLGALQVWPTEGISPPSLPVLCCGSSGPSSLVLGWDSLRFTITYLNHFRILF